MELQPKIEETEMFNFHIPEMEDSLLCDKLFIFRVDLVNNLSVSTIDAWLFKHQINTYLICKENGSQTEKPHVHAILSLPDNLTYKTISDYFTKQIVKEYNLEKHQFSKKKNGAKHHITTNPEFKKILKKYKMDWYDYAACYYCKDYSLENEWDDINFTHRYQIMNYNVQCNELKSRYDIIQKELNTLPKKKANQNMISLLIERWESIHQQMVNPNLSIVEPDYIRKLQEFIIQEISNNNKGNKMAHLFTSCRLKQYTQTILYTLNPEFAKRKMIYDYDDLINLY